MKKILLAQLAFAMFTIPAFAQLNMTLLSTIDYQTIHNSNVSDIWGYVDEANNEYAIVGYNSGGVSIVDVTDPQNPVEIWSQAGPQTIWRDIKTWGDYAYIGNEDSQGLLIIDLTPLPSSTNLPTANYTGNSYPFQSVHNIYIDENGVAYIIGANYGNGGAIFLDLTNNPMAPTELGIYDACYFHDLVTRGDTLWGSAIYQGEIRAIDVSNKSNPVLMGSWNTPHNFAHNAWISGDGTHLFTTDEVSGAFVTGYDVTDLGNVKETDRAQSNPGSGVIPHNTHWVNDYVVTSYYRDGVTVHDVSRPDNIIETGNYDTSPFQGNGFNGCWGVYPWLPSGNVIATDIELGLFVLGPTYTRGCYLEGNVVDSITQNPINNVDVQIVSTSAQDFSDVVGDYATGLATAGTYDVTFSKAGYYPKTETGVSLSNGNVTVLDIELAPMIPFSISGQVIESWSSNPVPNADVKIENNDFSYNVTTDNGGNFTIATFYQGSYEVTAGKWMFVTNCIPSVFNQSQTTVTVPLDSGIYDDFTFDFNWTETSNASSGDWERGEPKGTSFNTSGDSNPEYDVSNDCSVECYVTGNAGGGVGADDIDDGLVTLFSPVVDLTNYTEPYVSYYRWFFNDGGSGNPNDSLVIMIDNGSQVANIEVVTANSNGNSSWVYSNYKISDYVTVTSTMQFIFRASDVSPGHISEAGLDKFRVTDNGIPPVVDFTVSQTIICEDDSIDFTDQSTGGATAWSWQFPGGNPVVSTAQNPTVYYSTAGLYTVSLTAWNNSGSNMEMKVDHIQVDVCVDVEDIIPEGTQLFVHPNPFSSQTRISYVLNEPVSPNARIQVFDLVGTLIDEIAICNTTETVIFSSELANGVYFLRIVNGGEVTEAIRLIKM